MKRSNSSLIGMLCAFALSASGASPARADTINVSGSGCQPDSALQSEVARSITGVSTPSDLDKTVRVNCSVPRAALPTGVTAGVFRVFGLIEPGASMKCTLSSYDDFTGGLMGSQSFEVFGSTSNHFNVSVSLAAAQLNYFTFTGLSCVLPAFGAGTIAGIVSTR